MTIWNIVVLILAVIGMYHIIEEVRYRHFVKGNEEFLEKFAKEYNQENKRKG